MLLRAGRGASIQQLSGYSRRAIGQVHKQSDTGEYDGSEADQTRVYLSKGTKPDCGVENYILFRVVHA